MFGKKKKNVLYIVVPCYNEEEVLPITVEKIDKKITRLIKENKISKDSKVMFVNDGSKDKTWDMIIDISKRNKHFTGLSLSRNRGHQNALLAGLMRARELADIIISMDADLQDDINAIDDMIDKYYEGYDIVYGVRNSRKTDSFFKRTTAQMFYKLMNAMGAECTYNHADYRLTTKRVLDALSNYKEVNLFLRGLFHCVGFSSTVVYYKRKKRAAGESKYPLKKMLGLAWNGITSFSIKPLRMIFSIGLIVLFTSFVIMIYSLIRKITGNTVDGWTFLSISIWFIGGVQTTCIGILGEYIGKIYEEAKGRPRYIIEEDLTRK